MFLSHFSSENPDQEISTNLCNIAKNKSNQIFETFSMLDYCYFTLEYFKNCQEKEMSNLGIYPVLSKKNSVYDLPAQIQQII